MVLDFAWRSSNLQKPKRTRLLFGGWCLGKLFIQDLALNFAKINSDTLSPWQYSPTEFPPFDVLRPQY